MEDAAIFSYKQGSSFVHRIPSWCKILFIPLFNVAVFQLNWRFAAVCIVIQASLFFAIKFSVGEQFNDLKPALYYAVFLYVLNLFTNLYVLWGSSGFFELIKNVLESSIFDKLTAKFCIKFVACVQSCSMMFKTSTNLQLREGIEKIEGAVRRFLPCKKEPRFAFAVSMLLVFIPEVFKMWNQLTRAWKARGGKNGLKMILTLIPILFSLGFKFAYNCARAVLVRQV